MKKIFIALLLLFPLLVSAQGHKGSVEACSPMKNGKIYYEDQVDMDGMSQNTIFKGISKWAKKNYGKDVFLSNVVTNKKKHTILVSSTVELLLNDTDKTLVTYRMFIECFDGKYTASMTDIKYEYDPKNEKKHKDIPAEDVIANGGKSNKVSYIKNPKLFCDATYFFAENLFGDVFNSLDEDME